MFVNSKLITDDKKESEMITVDGHHPMFEVAPNSLPRILCKGFNQELRSAIRVNAKKKTVNILSSMNLTRVKKQN